MIANGGNEAQAILPSAAKNISAAWKAMSSEERKLWDEKAANDKLRYEVEKTIYSGPWKEPRSCKRPKKDETAPKRPMSAFLDYSRTVRSQVIKDNPQAESSKDISKILGEMWRKLTPDEKKPFVETELELRAKYKEVIQEWRHKNGNQETKERKRREAVVQHAVENKTIDELLEAAEISQGLTGSSSARSAPVSTNVPSAPSRDVVAHANNITNVPSAPSRDVVAHANNIMGATPQNMSMEHWGVVAHANNIMGATPQNMPMEHWGVVAHANNIMGATPQNMSMEHWGVVAHANNIMGTTTQNMPMEHSFRGPNFVHHQPVPVIFPTVCNSWPTCVDLNMFPSPMTNHLQWPIHQMGGPSVVPNSTTAFNTVRNMSVNPFFGYPVSDIRNNYYFGFN
eukprot:CAMPEP_0172435030 /NCGR_PEP_ID=MMETSP1064-20121228/70953_1 /TAXON_ID=202472 /ORGANISM="Aulacoseira subarctica , Strain CCAP 1002/5" /LENGTH=397 /DNA_ID=CAMNT_0013183301 /DNA_START=49 /DNA_END=1242 /DNA_ORIENTATION=+